MTRATSRSIPDGGAPRSLSAWLRLDESERAAAVDAAIVAAAASARSHGAYISTAVSSPHAAPGELSGIPFAVKDNIDAVGFATTAGSRLFLDARPEVDADVVSALQGAGALVIGKTNMHELAFGASTNNRHFGPARNPFDPTRTAGGSSGGGAAAVALGTVPFGLASDTGGSVNVPASFCGIVGFRPSTGRYPSGGMIGLSWSRDTVGVHATTVADVVTVDRVITGTRLPPEILLSGLRIGLPANRFADLDPQVALISDSTLRRLAAAGVELVDVEVQGDFALEAASGLDIVGYECRTLMPALLAARASKLNSDAFLDRIDSPDVRALMARIFAEPVDKERYERARRDRWTLRANYADVFDRHSLDAILQPTVCMLPPLVDDDVAPVHNARAVPYFPTAIRNTGPGSFAGVPMLSFPAGHSSTGLPVGMCLEGRALEDERMLRVALAVEAALTPQT
jgi:Asp-tRNA(Asn)/Glu-tRNA(Gln) amidotransferase A subunit family amidase